jgi:aspartyl-tRNA(Asn)/glutamyl-tRNA(Gln) amidotransferase subunit C
MPRVTAETVDHVARLAHLSLTDQERETFARQLEQVLAYAESIQALDVSGVEPMSHAAATEVFREDVPRQSLPRETILAAAPDADREAGLFRVPRVLGG